VIKEVETLFDVNAQLFDSRPEQVDEPMFSTGILVRHEALKRNKQIVLVYLNERLKKIRKLRWEMGSVSGPLKSCLSDEEDEFLRTYSGLLNTYQSSLGVDLTTDIAPPRDLFIEVLVLQDCGEIVTDTGASVILSKNTTHLMRRADAEPLIKRGFLQHQQG
jgi:GINS complex subunit 1